MRRTGPEEDAADRHALPDHAVVVGIALAGDDGGAEGERCNHPSMQTYVRFK